MKNIKIIIAISILFCVFCSCKTGNKSTSKSEIENKEKEIKTVNLNNGEIINKINSKNEILTKELNIEIKSNEEKIVKFELDTIEVSFKIKFKKFKNTTLDEFKINFEKQNDFQMKSKIIFSGNLEYIKNHRINQMLSEDSFLGDGTVFTTGRMSNDYSVTDVNAMPLNNNNFAVFKVLDESNKVLYFGILKCIITTDNIIFEKISYSKNIIDKIIE